MGRRLCRAFVRDAEITEQFRPEASVSECSSLMDKRCQRPRGTRDGVALSATCGSRGARQQELFGVVAHGDHRAEGTSPCLCTRGVSVGVVVPTGPRQDHLLKVAAWLEAPDKGVVNLFKNDPISVGMSRASLGRLRVSRRSVGRARAPKPTSLRCSLCGSPAAAQTPRRCAVRCRPPSCGPLHVVWWRRLLQGRW